ncbi:DUF6371 domain-containing protein [Hymenobacter siberiensis]|uniref:DUF6371 domain-containing protein n=1 Tax=Hymenobacter siberiensis TaxID=2848396 RepID=UPI001C1DD917|nr:DUF6371 domain-containing protein [Hymenobacter siberiensis]MBU6120007.1 hypothetical protein [Hymenobacter siberiensis]
MPTQTAHRYTLQPYAGPKSRTMCPACGKPRCFTRYLDTDTGELLPDEYGRCDREANCGHHRNPYHAGPGAASYAQQVRLDAKQERPAQRVSSRTGTPLPAPTPVLSIPADVFTATLGRYDRNALAQVLRGHFGRGVADELLSRFQVGTSAHWPGACVFWLLDTHGRVRGGQVVLYDATGHTVKEPRRCTTWAHTALAQHYQRRGHPAPPWLADYSQHGQKSPCLFGLPQLTTAPAAQPVALVESAKTAMLATPYFPRYVWLATMGLSYLTPDRMEPLRGRRIVLYPDAGCLDKWQAKADELRRLGYDVRVSDELEKLATDDERRAGLDLADVLLNEWPGYPPSWDEKSERG